MQQLSLIPINKGDQNRLKGKSSKFDQWLLFFAGCVLHILFSAEGIFSSWNWNYPLLVITRMVAYAVPGIIFSIVFIVPVFHYWQPKPRPKWPKMSHLIWAIYIGFAIRIASFFIDLA